MSYLARRAEVASEQYFALPVSLQALVDERVSSLLDDPDGLLCSYDPNSDQWTTTAGNGPVLILYVFRPGHPWLFVLRLVVI